MARTRTSLLVAATLAVFAVSIATVGASATEDDSWRYGVGTYTIEADRGVVERSIEAWIAPDGRYRVVTSSLGSPASEAVVFDGESQVAYIVDDRGAEKAAVGAGTAHYALTGDEFTKARTTGAANLSGGAGYSFVVDWADTSAQESLVAPYEGPTASLRDLRGLSGEFPDRGGVATRGSGSRTATFSNCVDAYNYVNASTGYFRATSTARGSCLYMDESLWGNSGVGGGGCILNAWLGSGPTAANFSSKYVYTSLSGLCSNHAGWNSSWALIVPWDGLDSAH